MVETFPEGKILYFLNSIHNNDNSKDWNITSYLSAM